MRRVWVVGCGDLGTRVARAYTERGIAVFGSRRHPGSLPSPIQRVPLDVADADSWSRLPPDLHSVTDIVYAVSASDGSDDAYRSAYVDGATRLRDWLGARMPRVLFVSSTSVYGQDDGEWVDETSETRPASFRGARLLEAEATLRVDRPASIAILRATGIYGPGRTALIERVRARGATDDSTWTNRIHVDDAASAIVRLLDAEVPGTFIGVDDVPARRCDVERFIADRLGAVERHRSSEAGPGRPVGGNKRCRNDRLRAIGWSPRYPSYREGYAALIDPSTAEQEPRTK